MVALDRQQDFVDLVKAISQGQLRDNIALLLILDIERFYGAQHINRMCYDQKTLNFWLTFQKLFKTIGVNSMRGYKGEAANSINSADCNIKCVVPSGEMLRHASKDYSLELETPGAIHQTLDAYSQMHLGEDVKLCTDGKKLAYGIGNSGEENLCGLHGLESL